MICHLCKENKLSEEFPFDPLTENCDHPLLHCFQCATESVQNNQKCSQCDNKVDENNEIYQEYMETLDFLFPNVDAEEAGLDDSSASAPCTATLSNIVVTTLSGDRATLSYNPNTKILDLKKEIEKELQVPYDKQRLLYQNTELKTTNHYNELSKMKEYNVPPNSTLYLVILLCAVRDLEGLDHVIFDLYWGYPITQTRRDFLDASVFLYSGLEYLDVVNFRHRYSYYCPDAVTHSGHADMFDLKREGHQKINVSIKSIPANIDNLVFTLSAWNSPNVSCYRKPSVKFFDAKFPDKQLCNDAMRHVAYSQSIIMCSLSKKDGYWHPVSLKKPAPGNAKGLGRGYGPLKTEIRSTLIKQGYF